MSAFKENIGWLIRNVSSIRPILDEIGFYASNEFRQNIDSGGRPQQWDPSTRVKAFGGQTLRGIGHLMNSMTHNIDSPMSVAVGPGSSVGYKAKLLYYGGVIKPKNGEYLTFKIPSRLVTRSKGGKELKKAREEWTWVKVRQVIAKPHDYLYLPPAAFERFDQIVVDKIAGVKGSLNAN